MARTWGVGILGLGHWYSAYGLARAMPEYPKAELRAVAWHDRHQLDDVRLDVRRRALRRIRAAARAARHRYRADRVAGRRRWPTWRSGPPRGQAHRPWQTDGDERGRGRPHRRRRRGAGVKCLPAQGNTPVPRRGSEDAHRSRGDRRHRRPPSDVPMVDRRRLDRIRQARDGSRIPRTCPAAPSSTRASTGWTSSAGSRAARSCRSKQDGEPGAQGHRGRGLGAGHVHVRQNGVIATLEAAWTINAPRATGPSPKQNSVVRLEIVGTRGEIIDQWFRSPGRAVLAAGAPDWVFERQPDGFFTPGVPFPLTHLIDALEANRPTPSDGPGCADLVRGRDGGLRLGARPGGRFSCRPRRRGECRYGL